MRLRLASLSVASLLALGATSCDRSKLPFFGQLGENCYPNGTCAAGLTCVDRRCVTRGSDDGGRPDIGFDAGRDGGGDGLAPCWPPGSACAPSDPCATSGSCSAAGTCVPLGGCDDGLDCTIDSCSGPGQCAHEVKAGACALATPGAPGKRCFADGDADPQNPCRRCDSKVEREQWTALADGSPCDDGDPCTGPDRCQAGQCSPTGGDSCDDGLACTQDQCDGKGGCLAPVVDKGSCAIDGACYADGALAKDAGGVCRLCDAQTSQTSWAPVSACQIDDVCVADGAPHPKAGSCASCDTKVATDKWTLAVDTCLIDDSCKKSGDASPDGCSTCDPQKDPLAWTPAANKCAIAGACVADNTAHPSGCMRCDPAQDATGWSAVGATTVQSVDFEGSSALPSGWSTDTTPAVRWQLAKGKRARAGTGAAYYGDLAKGSYDSGSQSNKGTLSWGTFDLPAGTKAGLRFHVWMDVENTNQFDTLELYIVDDAGNASQLWKRPTGLGSLRSWLTVDVDLSVYAGKTKLKLEWRFDTVDNLNNKGEGVYIDEVVLYTGC